MIEQSYIFFDLDGTLTDSGEGIMNSVRKALQKLGHNVPGEEVLRRFIGPPLIYSFQEYCGLSEEDAYKAIAAYRETYAVTGLFENRVYEGIELLLVSLKKAGKTLAVATSKPEVYSVRIIEHFGLDKYFDLNAGSSLDESRNTKEAVIRYAMEKLGITDPGEVLMVGDREHDVLGAAACNIQCVGVLWGYGSREELLNAGASAVVTRPEELYCGR